MQQGGLPFPSPLAHGVVVPPVTKEIGAKHDRNDNAPAERPPNPPCGGSLLDQLFPVTTTAVVGGGNYLVIDERQSFSPSKRRPRRLRSGGPPRTGVGPVGSCSARLRGPMLPVWRAECRAGEPHFLRRSLLSDGDRPPQTPGISPAG